MSNSYNFKIIAKIQVNNTDASPEKLNEHFNKCLIITKTLVAFYYLNFLEKKILHSRFIYFIWAHKSLNFKCWQKRVCLAKKK